MSRLNEQITNWKVRVLAQNGDDLGLMVPSDAIALARKAGLDLVEVEPREMPPVCRITKLGETPAEVASRERRERLDQERVAALIAPDRNKKAQLIAKATGYMIVKQANGQLPISQENLMVLMSGNQSAAARFGMSADEFQKQMFAAARDGVSTDAAQIDALIAEAIEIIKRVS